VGTKPLLTISAFARAVELTPSTLRYYDEAGLLPPAEVDPRSGYRYYTPELERRARLIGRMREVGVPVETMRLVLDSTPDQAVEPHNEFVASGQHSGLSSGFLALMGAYMFRCHVGLGDVCPGVLSDLDLLPDPISRRGRTSSSLGLSRSRPGGRGRRRCLAIQTRTDPLVP